MALDQRLEEVHEDRIGALDGLVQAVLLLLRREVRREEEHRQLAVVVQRVGELAELLLDRVELVLLRGDLEQRRARIPGRSLPWRLPASGGGLLPPLALASTEDAEVEVAQGLLDEALLVGLGQRLARDLLGREHRQVGDLAADLVDRPAGLGLDVAAGLLEQALALGAGGLDGFLLMRVAGLAGAGDDLIGLRARLGEPLAVLGRAPASASLRSFSAESIDSAIDLRATRRARRRSPGTRTSAG